MLYWGCGRGDRPGRGKEMALCFACSGQGFWQAWDGEGFFGGSCGDCEGEGFV